MSDQQQTVGDILREYLNARAWGQADLAQVIGKTTAAVNEIIQGKRAVSSEMAALLAVAFRTTPEFWLTLEANSRVPQEALDEAKWRARLFEFAPVREMIRRGWISASDEVSGLEAELKRFFGVDSLESPPQITGATRRSGDDVQLTPSQLAWCFRARNLAADLLTPPFDDSRLSQCEGKLKDQLAHAPTTKNVPRILAEFGIRFVIVQPLSESKIDGAAMWLDDSKPVIALSMRMDRIDSFWFTLFHEFYHIKYRDLISVDSRLTGEDAEFSAAKPDYEQRADLGAASAMIPQELINSFIKRIAPLYSKERIIQFAHRIRVHPGIIVGQLQHRGEIKFSANREMLIKVRDKVTSTSVVDGWGNSIS